MLQKSQQLGIIFTVSFVVLILFYYLGKPSFVLEDKDATDKKVSNSKSIGLSVGLSILIVILSQLLIKETPQSLRMAWKMGGGCGCRE